MTEVHKYAEACCRGLTCGFKLLVTQPTFFKNTKRAGPSTQRAITVTHVTLCYSSNSLLELYLLLSVCRLCFIAAAFKLKRQDEFYVGCLLTAVEKALFVFVSRFMIWINCKPEMIIILNCFNKKISASKHYVTLTKTIIY